MEYTYNTNNGQCEVKLTGKLMFDDHQSFRHVLALLDQNEVQALTLDFSNIEFIDSAGLGMLLLAKDAAEQRQVRLMLRGASGQVAKMFSISEFDKIFSIER